LCNHILQNVFEKTYLRQKATLMILNTSPILSHYFTFIFSALLQPGNFINPNTPLQGQNCYSTGLSWRKPHILNRVCIWCNDTTTKQVINYKHELIVLWACYLNTNGFGSWLGIRPISTTEIQLLPCILRRSVVTVNMELFLMSK